MRLFKTITLFVFLLSSVAQADIVGTWGVSDQQVMKVYYKDDQHMRMDVGNNTYMLVIGAKAYVVMDQGAGTIVMDMDAMGGAVQMMGGAAMRQAQAQASQYDPNSVEYTKTGKEETIAGYKGLVYLVSVKGPKGIETSEIVASTDKKVITLQNALIKISKRMAQSVMPQDMMAGFTQAADMVGDKGIGGLLRYEKQMMLKSLEETDLSPSVYAIPKGAATMSLPGFGR